MEIIVYAPPTWMPTVVFSRGDAKSLVANHGYRYEPPAPPRLPVEVEMIIQSEDMPPPDEMDSPFEDETVNVNEASLSELTNKLPTVGIARARRVIEARPLRVIEDLIEADPKIDWHSIAHLIRFD
jgi:DNA uptake protein ComE-like DNA-binding protein